MVVVWDDAVFRAGTGTYQELWDRVVLQIILMSVIFQLESVTLAPTLANQNTGAPLSRLWHHILSYHSIVINCSVPYSTLPVQCCIVLYCSYHHHKLLSIINQVQSQSDHIEFHITLISVQHTTFIRHQWPVSHDTMGQYGGSMVELSDWGYHE